MVNINAKAQLQVVLFKPISFGEETRAIADELLNNHPAALNLEKTEKDDPPDLDFLSGVAYVKQRENQAHRHQHLYYHTL